MRGAPATAAALLVVAGCASSDGGGQTFLRFTVDGKAFAYYDAVGRRDGADLILAYDDWVRLGRLTLRFPAPGTLLPDPYPLAAATYLPASSTGGEYSTAYGGNGTLHVPRPPSCRYEDTPPGDFLGAPVGPGAWCTLDGTFEFVAYTAAGDPVTVTGGAFRMRYPN